MIQGYLGLQVVWDGCTVSDGAFRNGLVGLRARTAEAIERQAGGWLRRSICALPFDSR